MNVTFGATSLVAVVISSLVVLLAVYVLLPAIALIPLCSMAPIIIQGAIVFVDVHEFKVAFRWRASEFSGRCRKRAVDVSQGYLCVGF